MTLPSFLSSRHSVQHSYRVNFRRAMLWKVIERFYFKTDPAFISSPFSTFLLLSLVLLSVLRELAVLTPRFVLGFFLISVFLIFPPFEFTP